MWSGCNWFSKCCKQDKISKSKGVDHRKILKCFHRTETIAGHPFWNLLQTRGSKALIVKRVSVSIRFLPNTMFHMMFVSGTVAVNEAK